MPTRAPATPAVRDARALTRAVSRSFALACRLLPADVRDDVHLLYSVFRALDDLVDGGMPEAAERVRAVEDWAAARPGAVTREVTLLRWLDGRHRLPRGELAEFCAGMREDMACQAPATEADVDRYCYRVAGTVGVVMACVLGTRDAARARPAAVALGMAMQRTNILRDIDEDLGRGRVYVARETLERFGGPGALAPGARAALAREQIARADALYDRAEPGIALLRRGRRAIAAATGMYREILRQIERDGHGVRAPRAVVSRPRKLAIAARRGVLAR